MKEQKTTITIVRDKNGYYYGDNAINVEEANMVEVFGLMISRLAATIQYDYDFGNNVEYKIDVTKKLL